MCKLPLSLGILLLISCLDLRAEVTLPSIFSDHMVLQAGKPVSVWGKAAPGEKVTVEFQGKSASATPDAGGAWKATLDALPKGGPGEMVIRGSNEIRIRDVLVGEVWLCSGQSNMAMQVDGLHGTVDNAPQEIAEAKYPEIRQFAYDKIFDIYTLDAPPREPQFDRPGRWYVCSPETVSKFTALGYFTARELFRKLDTPVGIINAAVGGTPVEGWTSLEAQKANPALQPVLDSWQNELTGYDPAADLAKYETDKAAWLKERARLTAAGQPVPKAPLPFKNRLVMEPAGLFNGMISPLIPYSIRGILWYQGERNAAGPLTHFYGEQFKTLIADWRAHWGEDLYFFYVQIANVQKVQQGPVQEKGWGVWVRDGQLKALSMPKTGMAITIDLGGEKAGHPTNKQQFAERLARIILHDAYEQPIPVWSGPLYQSAVKADGKMIVSFKYGEGLKAREGDLKGFAIAGADQKFSFAQARIEGDKVVVWADQVKDPASVRYSWGANPVGNLYNGGDLPASPFRTDDWPPATAAPKPQAESPAVE